MTVAIGMEGGAGGPVGAGAGAGADAAVGAGRGVGAILHAGTAAGPEQGTANGSVAGGMVAGKESFQSNWQTMLQAWGMTAGAGGGAVQQGSSEAAASSSEKNLAAPLANGDADATRQRNSAGSQGAGTIASVTAPGPSVQQSAALATRNVAGAFEKQVQAEATEAPASTESDRGPAGRASSAKSPRHKDAGEDRGGAQQTPVPADGTAAAASTGEAPVSVQAQASSAAPLARPEPDSADRTVSADAAGTAGMADRLAKVAESQNGTGMGSTPGTDKAWQVTNLSTTRETPVGQTFSVAGNAKAGSLQNAGLNETGNGAHSGTPNLAGVEPLNEARDEKVNDAAALQLNKPEGADARQQAATQTVGQATNMTPAIQAAEGLHEVVISRQSELRATVSVPVPGAPKGNGVAESTQPVMAQPSHEATAGGASRFADQIAAVPIPAAQTTGATEVSAWVRDPAAGQGTVHTAAGIEPGPAGITAAPREPFAAIDSGTAVGAPGWIHAGGQHAEAGFEDPALGWVGVRADVSGGNIHAAVVPGSAEAAQALSGHLAGLNTYLSEQHTPVATLTVAAPDAGGIKAGVDQGKNESAGQSQNQNAAQAPQPDAYPAASANAATRASGTAGNSGFDERAFPAGARGVHISVMA